MHTGVLKLIYTFNELLHVSANHAALTKVTHIKSRTYNNKKYGNISQPTQRGNHIHVSQQFKNYINMSYGGDKMLIQVE